MPPFESCLHAQSSPLPGVIITQVVGDPDGPAIFHFDTRILSAEAEVFTFDLYYPVAGWVAATAVSAGGAGQTFIRLGDYVREYPSAWRFVPPSVGITFAGGSMLEMLQSGSTV